MRARGFRVILTAALTVAAACTATAEPGAAEPVKTTVSHKAWNGVQFGDWVNNPSCSSTRNADIWEPTASGKHPVAIVTVGTGGSITAPVYQELAKEFARQGFVSVVPDYNSLEIIFPINMSRVKAKASCTYTPTRPESVMTKVCARAKADCTKGIVTAGHSQGGAMALLGYDHDPRIDAAYVWGTGNDVPFTMPKSRIRVIAGETDTQLNQPADLNAMTGLNCADQWECFIGPNGNGWRRVRNTEVQDGNADHCFTTNGGCLASAFASAFASALDTNTMNPAVNWSYPANVTWLEHFVSP